MGHKFFNIKRLSAWAQILAIMAALLLGIPGWVLAKRGGDQIRSTVYGVVEARPETLVGRWVIGGRVFMADGTTEFDQSEGPLRVGTCAKVHLRDGFVHEIDSEPMRNCP